VIAPRYLIDENLSPALVEPARQRGFEAMHVNHLGLRTETDWELLKVIAEQDWILVTNNAIEFRGRYRDLELHPGVVFLLPAVRRPEQVQLFEAALDHVQSDPDMTNRALDVSFDLDRTAVVTVYDLPCSDVD
jgi:predicted nuclease of predicted toxin-antitoxin system